MWNSHSAALNLNFTSTREMLKHNHRLVRKSSTGWRSAPTIQARLILGRQSYCPGSFRADFRNWRARVRIFFWNLVRTFASAFPNLGQGWVQIHFDILDSPIFTLGWNRFFKAPKNKDRFNCFVNDPIVFEPISMHSWTPTKVSNKSIRHSWGTPQARSNPLIQTKFL